MDYRDFELANQQCKPKHFGPPTAMQRRLAYDAAHRLPAPLQERPHALAQTLRWLQRLGRRIHDGLWSDETAT